MSSDGQMEKRFAKCTGCGTPISEHGWGIPSKFCEGEELSSPSARKKTAAVAKDEDEQIADLEQELAELNFEEERRGKQKRIALLQQQIEDKRTRLAADDLPEQAAGDLPEPAGPSNVKELRSFLRTDALTTPLDGILNPANATYGGIEQQVPLLNNPSRSQYGDFTVPQPLQSQSNAWLESRASEMLLRPAQLQKGEKALRIVDYIDNIVPKDEERTLADGGNTKPQPNNPIKRMIDGC